MNLTSQRNAMIESTSLQIERGFFLDAWLYLDYGGAGQGFGGFVLHKKYETHRAFAGHFIYRCLEIAGVEKWSELPGRCVRVMIGKDERIEAIGHILKNDWFYPKIDFEVMKENK